jgi:hypothetical protein
MRAIRFASRQSIEANDTADVQGAGGRVVEVVEAPGTVVVAALVEVVAPSDVVVELVVVVAGALEDVVGAVEEVVGVVDVEVLWVLVVVDSVVVVVGAAVLEVVDSVVDEVVDSVVEVAVDSVVDVVGSSVVEVVVSVVDVVVSLVDVVVSVVDVVVSVEEVVASSVDVVAVSDVEVVVSTWASASADVPSSRAAATSDASRGRVGRIRARATLAGDLRPDKDGRPSGRVPSGTRPPAVEGQGRLEASTSSATSTGTLPPGLTTTSLYRPPPHASLATAFTAA